MSAITSQNSTTKKVGELFKVLGGGTPSTANPNFWKGPISWVTSADLDEQLTITSRKAVSREAIKSSATNLVPAGSIVVATRVGLGKVGIAETELCFSQDCQGVILDPKVCDSKFAALQLKIRVQNFKHISRGTTIAGVTKKQLLEIPFDLPPLDEQYRIVAEIDKQFTRLEVGMVALRRVQANLKRYRAAVLKAACEGRLVPGNLKSWRKITLGEVVISMKNGIYKPRDSYADDGIACLRMYNIETGKIVWKEIKRMRLSREEIQEYGLFPGDLLVNRVNSRELVGKAAAIPVGLDECVFESKNIRVRLRTDQAEPRFVSFALSASGSSYFNRNAQQVVGMASISQPQVAGFPLAIPPLDEQKRIVAEVERRLSVVEELETLVFTNLARSQRLRQSVLQQAFEGKLVNDLAATDTRRKVSRL